MNGWLLDTNVLSELKKARPAVAVVRFVSALPAEQMFVSVVTLAEIRFGIDRIADPGKRAELVDWLTHRVRPQFAQRTLPISEDVMTRWLVMMDAGRRSRVTYSQPDLFIAATAMQHDLVVVTRNVTDFERTGCAIKNPWG